MGLITPGPSWAHWSDNLSVVSANGQDYGTGVTAGNSNADGSSVGILSSLAHDCEYLVLGITGFGASSINSSTLLDILIDPAGGTTWDSTPLISDLLAGYTAALDLDASSNIFGVSLMYHFPLWIPAGASIGARARTAHTSDLSGRIVAYAAGGNRNPASWWCGQKVETVGTFNTGASIGQAHTPGASGAYSSWADLGSALGADGGAVQWAVQGTGASASSGRTYRFEFGAGSAQIGPCIFKGLSLAEVATHFFPGPVFYNFPSGTQLQVRAACGGTSPQAIDCAAYIVQ